MKKAISRREQLGFGTDGRVARLIALLIFAVPRLALGQMPTSDEALRAAFQNPPSKYTQVPFWFWNGEMEPDRLVAQIDEMQAHGVHGFVIHARIGLSEEVGYLTDRWFSLVRLAVEEADRRGMIVYLYDEGMYPSGSAHGRVVEGRPDLGAQGLKMISRRVRGPDAMQLGIALEQGEELVAVVQMQWAETQQKYLAHTARIVSGADARIPSGEWGIFMFIRTASGGVIRGVHWDEEDNQPNAPLAADLLNPEATDRFLAFTHERYHEALGSFFGTTVKGIFTDEPSMLGRRAQSGLRPWTSGLEFYASELLGYDFRLVLPFLFGVEAQDGREEIVEDDFSYVLSRRLNEAYYQPLSFWCEQHGVALTGHPAEAGDLQAQVLFQHPGQDVVWRWVLPGETAVEGEQSTSAKSAESVAAQQGRDIVVNEAFGAYGWQLTTDEMKWLADWLFVRGTNRLIPHAFYYSDQPPRLYERPPDLSWYNLWWEHYGTFADYTDRISWLLAEADPEIDVAVLATPGHTPWRVARFLLENQIDYHYLSLESLDAVSEGRIGRVRYRSLIVDGDLRLTYTGAKALLRLLDEGLHLNVFDGRLLTHPLRPLQEEAVDLAARITEHDRFNRTASAADLMSALSGQMPKDLRTDPPAHDLRYRHVVRAGRPFYLITNEGDHTISTRLYLRQPSLPEVWDAETGAFFAAEQPVWLGDEVSIWISLPPRTSRILAFGFDGAREPFPDVSEASETTRLTLPTLGWRLDADGDALPSESLGSWTNIPGMEGYSGTVRYRNVINISRRHLQGLQRAVIDCGDASAFVRLELNGESAGVRLWKPFAIDVSGLLRPGNNEISIYVTNTRANELTGASLPSGLFGPVRLVLERIPAGAPGQ